MIFLLKTMGLLAGASFAYSALPAAFMTIKNGKSIGTPISIAWAITLGTILMYFYLFFSYHFDWVITVNLSVEFLTWLVIIKYHYFPNK